MKQEILKLEKLSIGAVILKFHFPDPAYPEEMGLDYIGIDPNDDRLLTPQDRNKILEAGTNAEAQLFAMRRAS